MSKNIYQNRYEHLLDLIARHGGQTAVADKLGVSKQYVHLVSAKDPKRVKNIGHRMARKIEEAFGLPINSIDDPLGGATVRPGDDAVDIPPLNLVLAVTPDGAQAQNAGMVRRLSITKQWLRHNTDASSFEHLSRMEMRGDSMEPTLLTESTLLIDTAIRRIEGSAVYVLAKGSELFVRRVQKNIDGSYDLISDNAAYPAQSMDDPVKAGVIVCGRIVGALNPRKM